MHHLPTVSIGVCSISELNLSPDLFCAPSISFYPCPRVTPPCILPAGRHSCWSAYISTIHVALYTPGPTSLSRKICKYTYPACLPWLLDVCQAHCLEVICPMLCGLPCTVPDALLSWPWSFFGCNIPNTADVLSVITNNWSWESNGKTLTGFCQRNIVCPNSKWESAEKFFFSVAVGEILSAALTRQRVHPNRGHCAPKFAAANKNFTHNPPPLATPPSLSHFLSKFDADFLHLQNQVDRGVAREKKNKTILWPEFCRRLLSGSKSLAGRLIWLVGDISLTDGQRVEWEMAIYCDILNPKNGWQAHVCG